MTTKINYEETSFFQRALKNLSKKFKTLHDDIEVAKRSAIELLHLNGIDNQSIALIPGYKNENFQIYKLRKFACRSLKGKGVKSGIRIIYAYNQKIKKIIFIEIYFKADQENEDKKRIEEFLKLAKDRIKI